MYIIIGTDSDWCKEHDMIRCSSGLLLADPPCLWVMRVSDIGCQIILTEDDMVVLANCTKDTRTASTSSKRVEVEPQFKLFQGGRRVESRNHQTSTG